MGRVAFIHRRASMSIATTSRGVSGVVQDHTGQAVSIHPRANTATVPAPTSASGAARPPMAPAAFTARLGNTRSKIVLNCMTIEIGENKLEYDFKVDEHTRERHVVVKSGCDAKGDLVIPAIINGCPVTEIGDFSFFCSNGLTGVEIPHGVTDIGHLAFRNCTGLTRVAISDSVKRIKHRAFNGCTGLTSVTIGKGVTCIDSEAFCGCRELSDMTIQGNVTDLGLNAFAGCEKLADTNGFFVQNGVLYAYFGVGGEIVIPDGVVCIVPRVFYGRRNLTRVVFPDSLTSIGAQTFCCCHGLNQIMIPKCVTSIESCAFWSCSGLEKVDIPEHAIIGEGVFDDGVTITKY